MPDGNARPRLRRPIVIVGAPRSGTTILQTCLAMHEDIWHLRAESHHIMEGPFHPSLRGYESNRLTADDAVRNPDGVAHVRRAFYDSAVNLSRLIAHPEHILGAASPIARALGAPAFALARPFQHYSKARAQPLRFVEKTPKNSLRVPFLERVFDNPLFLYVQRAAFDNIRSIHTGWTAEGGRAIFRPRFGRHGYPVTTELALRDYYGSLWKFALVPEWRSLRGRTLLDVATWQYLQSNRYAHADLTDVAPARVFFLRHEEFVGDPQLAVDSILAWADLPTSPAISRLLGHLPRVNTITPSPRHQVADERLTVAILEAELEPHAARTADFATPQPGWLTVGRAPRQGGGP